jgi:hypothetical protein
MSVEAYEVGQRSDKRGVNLISDALPFGRLWYGEPNAISDAIGYATHRSRRDARLQSRSFARWNQIAETQPQPRGVA